MILSFRSAYIVGANGDRYGIPRKSKLTSCVNIRIAISRIPCIPKMAPPIIKPIRYILRADMKTGSTKISDDMAVIATTIIIIGDTIPAFTAASPKISAPTIEMAELAKLGNFRSLSLRISKAIIISNASTNVENGTLSLCAAILINNCVGMIS